MENGLRQESNGLEAAPLRQHIEHGIALLSRGQTPEAQMHFLDAKTAKTFGVTINREQLMCAPLMDEKEVLKDARLGSLYWSWSKTGYRRMTLIEACPNPPYEIIEGSVRRNKQFTDDPGKYLPENVALLQRHMALTQIEPWLYEWRDRASEPLAGLEEPSADNAALLSSYGLILPAEYLTRTRERMEWAVDNFPARESELERFCRESGLGFPSSNKLL